MDWRNRNREEMANLEIVCLNFSLDGVSLCPTIRKPFDLLAEGLVWKNSRDDRRWTFPNELTAEGLLQIAIAQSQEFQADEISVLAESCTEISL